MEGLFYAGRQMYLSKSDVQAIVDPSSSPIREYMNAADKKGRLIKLNRGKKPRALIVMKNGTLYLSALSLRTLSQKFQTSSDAPDDDQPDE